MGRTEQALLLLLGVVATGRALKVDDVPHPVVRKLSDWTYYPENASIGIVTGGTPDLYARANYGSKAASIMLKYAKKHGYAFYVDKNLGRLSTRAKGWNKVMLMMKLLREVETLVWMDADMVIMDVARPFDQLLGELTCDGAEQGRWAGFLPHSAESSTFLWMSADTDPAHYLVNANTAMVALRRSPEAFDFLTKVWRAGYDPNHFKHHDDPLLALHRDPASPDYGWPFEQGAFWDVLASQPNRYMRKACIAPASQLHSVKGSSWTPGQFAQHCAGFTDEVRNKRAQAQLMKLGGKPGIQ
mmetsp:Transcript_36530/g.110172  ORF Transcript_36530/g.110172 Transcript_36530/m.110172 type:complete len:300 (-) Transcript_36530:85-984(-)